MHTATLSVLPRFLVAVLTVLFIGACDILNAPPDDLEPSPFTKCLRSVEPPEALEASNSEIRLACLIKAHEGQQREEMNYQPDLGEEARWLADDLAENGFYDEEDRNALSRSSSVTVITSIGVGSTRSTPKRLLQRLLESPDISEEILATPGGWRAETTDYGIGLAMTENSVDYPGRTVHYAAIILATPLPSE